MSSIPTLAEAAEFFRSAFRANTHIQAGEPRWVGLENEYLLVNSDGTMAQREVLSELWRELASLGWEDVRDEATAKIIGVKRNRSTFRCEKTYHYDLITTDLGYAVLEIDLAPAQSLHEASQHLRSLVELVTVILHKRDTVLLAYGVQPVTGPDPAYKAASSRSTIMLEVCKRENAIFSPPYGVELHTIDAACQTQVEVGEDEAITVVNALNATSGLRIALLANSPIWQNSIAHYKALRRMFVDWCWPCRAQQLGMPLKFQNIEHYIDYIFDFRPILVKRNQRWYQMSNHSSFLHFFTAEQGEIGMALDGSTENIFGNVEDIICQSGIAWFNARLQPAYGTVEDRVSCQQPPQEHLCASALTLGLVENYQELQKLSMRLSQDQWRDIERLAATYGMALYYPGVNVNELIHQMLVIADQGLKQRGMQESIYLAPLFERVNTKCGPADEIIRQFLAGGIAEIVVQNDMRRFQLPNDTDAQS